jgi:hypothetical protein
MNNDENILNIATVDEPDIPQNIKIKPLIYFSDFGAPGPVPQTCKTLTVYL